MFEGSRDARFVDASRSRSYTRATLVLAHAY